MNPTNEQGLLRTQIGNTLYNHGVGFSLADANGRTVEQMVEELVDALVRPATAHTNAEIAKVLDRLAEQSRLQDYSHGTTDSGRVRRMVEAIEAERAKLKEVK